MHLALHQLGEADDRIEGVRSSWLIWARNSLLERLATSACSLANRSSRVRSATGAPGPGANSPGSPCAGLVDLQLQLHLADAMLDAGHVQPAIERIESLEVVQRGAVVAHRLVDLESVA